jgi:hypothetical protein
VKAVVVSPALISGEENQDTNQGDVSGFPSKKMKPTNHGKKLAITDPPDGMMEALFSHLEAPACRDHHQCNAWNMEYGSIKVISRAFPSDSSLRNFGFSRMRFARCFRYRYAHHLTFDACLREADFAASYRGGMGDALK